MWHLLSHLVLGIKLGHKQKFKNIRIAVRERKLVITVEAFEDIALEQALFDAKTSYFENVYSMKPVLKEKRIYNY